MKAKLFILLSFLGLAVFGQVQNFNVPVNFNNVNEALPDDSIQVLVRTNPQASGSLANRTKWVSKSAFGASVNYGSAGQIPYVNSTGYGFDYAPNLFWNYNSLLIGTVGSINAEYTQEGVVLTDEENGYTSFYNNKGMSVQKLTFPFSRKDFDESGIIWGDLEEEDTGFFLTDNSHTKTGIEYTEDYSANYTDRSLIDRGYAVNNYLLLSGTQEDKPVTGNIEVSLTNEFNGFEADYSGSAVHNGISDDGLPSWNIQGDYTSNFSLGTDFARINSDKVDFQGIVGNEEYDKVGNRKAFAQLSDVEDLISDVGINDLNNSPGNFTGASSKLFAVNSAGNAFEYRSLILGDFNLSPGSEPFLIGYSGGGFTKTAVRGTATANTIPMRDANQRMKAGEGLAGDDVSTISQTTLLYTNQTVAGVKTFSSSPIVPNPTTSGQAVNLGYLQTNYGNGSLRFTLTGIQSGGVVPEESTFELLLFSSCPVYTDNFISWDITWLDGNDYKSIKTEYVANGAPLRLSKALGCLSVKGNSLLGFTIPTTAVLELRY